MADQATEEKNFSILWDLVRLLSVSAQIMAGTVTELTFVDAGTPRARFRHEKPDVHVFQVLMCVRIASGLRAALILMRENHLTEAAVVMRTIEECVSHIEFIDGIIHESEASAAALHNDSLNLYFGDMQADGGRGIFATHDPSRPRNVSKMLAESLGTAVHGARRSPCRQSLGTQVHLALDVFFKVARNLGHTEMARQLLQLRRRFEADPAYHAT
jgi:hypothetical protein